jgi:ATP-dependent Clp protease adaptor protein ClpS
MPGLETTETTVDAPPIRVRVGVKPRHEAEPKKQPPYAVVLHNDPINRFEWVIGVLCTVLRCGGSRAFWLVLKTHVSGRGPVWSGSLEVAEFKAEQIRAFGPDPAKATAGAKPLFVTVEPMPG